MDSRQVHIYAGGKLRALRESQQLTQQQIEKLTADRFGAEQRVYAQQVSRIEKGTFDKPPILDLLRLGQVLGLSADDIAELYRLWPRSKTARLDPALQAATELAQDLHGMERQKFLDWVQFAVLQARSEQRARMQERQSASSPNVQAEAAEHATEEAEDPTPAARAPASSRPR